MSVPRFPDLFDLWRSHDLASFRPAFYANLAPGDETRVWGKIEEQYLLRYTRFLRVWFEWGADGIWGIPFPGSVSVRGAFRPDDFGIGPETSARLLLWHSNIDANPTPWIEGDAFDYEASDREGLEVARLIRRELPPDIYLEFDPFRELKMVGDDVIELPIPPFIERMATPGE